jgi:hypothetical protein
VSQIHDSEDCERYFKLENNRVFLDAHEIALLHNVFENQNLEEHGAA